MHSFVITFLKSLAIRVRLFLAMHKNPRVKSDNDLISASLGSRNVVIPAPTSFRIERE